MPVHRSCEAEKARAVAPKVADVKNMDLPTISHFADVEVGITTGSNDYFTVPQSVVNGTKKKNNMGKTYT